MPREEKRPKVSSVTGAQVQVLMEKIRRVRDILPTPPLQQLRFDCDVYSGQYASSTQVRPGQQPPKHVLQEQSIIAHALDAAGLALPPNTKADREETSPRTVVEFGSGTARLSDHWQTLRGLQDTHLLIDRQNFKDGRDATMRTRLSRWAEQGPSDCSCGSVHRLTRDIKDVNLQSTLHDIGAESQVVAISKHLCGPALDYTLGCIRDYTISSAEGKASVPCALATCCHYLCEWDTYSNPTFFERLGFSREDFRCLCVVSQWATLKLKQKESNGGIHASKLTLQSKATTCTPNEADHAVKGDAQMGEGSSSETVPNIFSAFRMHEEIDKEQALMQSTFPEGLDSDALARINSVSSDEFERTFGREEKVALGLTCKLLLDLGRAEKLRSLGYQSVRLIRYTTLSKENMLVIATP